MKLYSAGRVVWILWFGLISLSVAPSFAQEEELSRRTFRANRTEGIRVDGVLDEPAWQSPPTFTLEYETSPGDNSPAPVHTEMWVAFDHATLYVAARAHDPRPEQIRARLTDRDTAFQDDIIGVVLDTFNDERRAFEFLVNPLGVQMDLSQNDVTGNEDESWDAIWDSNGRITSDGFEVEMAIPFTSLRFPGSDSMTWGIDAVRIWPRDQRYRIGLNKIPRGKNCYLCNESKLVGLEGIKPGRNMEFDPTLTAQRLEQRPEFGQPFENDHNVDPGITGRWGITPGITLNGTANPDFSQVEADAAQLTVNTQFAIFYPEKRPFFLEGADFFDTKIGAVYTRDVADPSWGVKVSGKGGRSAFGAIVARDDRTNFLFPGNQSTELGSIEEPNTSSIFRYRYDIGGSGSTIGGLLTSREGSSYHNRVVGGDALFRWGHEATRIEILGSTTAYPESIRNDFDQPDGTLLGTAMRAAYQHQTEKWQGYVLYTGASDDFRADLGFIPQVGYHNGYGLTERYWYSDHNEHWWRKITLGTETTWTYDRQGNPLQQQVAPYFYVNGPREFFSAFYAGFGPSYYNGQRFDRNLVNWEMEMRPTGTFYFTFETRLGQEIDYDNTRQGRIFRAIPGVRFDLGRRWRIQLDHNYERLSVEDGLLYQANVLESRITYQINTRTFIRAISQYFDVSRNPSLYTFPIDDRDKALFNQFLFSYKVNPQVVLFLGYSDNYANGPSNPLTQANRTIFFKVGYAFVM